MTLFFLYWYILYSKTVTEFLKEYYLGSFWILLKNWVSCLSPPWWLLLGFDVRCTPLPFLIRYRRSKNSVDWMISNNLGYVWRRGLVGSQIPFLQISTYIMGFGLWAFYCPCVNCSIRTFWNRLKASSPTRGTSTVTAEQQEWDHWGRERRKGLAVGYAEREQSDFQSLNENSWDVWI